MEDNQSPEKSDSGEKLIPRIIEDEMKKSYLAYSMSVIVGRALPDVKDGLKPVHRRILFAMNEMGMHSNKPFKKSARIVGEVLGKYHPHGDSAVYDAMVRMVQGFSLRYPLVQGQGNFGSIDGDSAAAMRYTEARLNKLSEEMLQDIEKETVKFAPNFDGSLEEPLVLPSKVPNLLINGSSGIAVGMATNIPPHNISEVCEAVAAVIDNPEIAAEWLMKILPAPDFPTGGIICGTDGVKSAYNSGRGKIIIRAKANVEEYKKKQRIIVSEIPYQVNKSYLIEEIADLVRDKKIRGISDLRDESDREGMRIVIELKIGANSDIVLNQLYAHTRMQTTFGVILLGLVDNQPKVLNLKQLIQYFIEHRQEIVRKRTEFDLKKAEDRAHILEGIIVALDNIDPVIKLVKGSKNVAEAKSALMINYTLSEKQAQAILDMKLQRLTSLEQDKVKDEHKSLLRLIEELKSILASEEKILSIIKDELAELKEKYGDERRTQILEMDPADTRIDEESLIKPEDMIVTITHSGYIKRLPISTYKSQKRGGRGVMAAGTKEEDFVEHLFIANTTSYILFFTNKGKVHWIKVYKIPEASRQARGTAIINLLGLSKDERITAFMPVNEFKKDQYLIMATKSGIIKKTGLDEFSNPRRGGIIAISLNKGDELMDVALTDGNKSIIIASKKGMAVHFKESDVRAMGRTAIGVRGIKLRDEDEVVDMVVAESNKTLLTLTERGFGKRTNISEYRQTRRGGVGVTNIKITDKNGNVVSIKSVEESDEIMLISEKGIMIRTKVKEISVIGRSTQGVRVMKLEKEDSLVAAAKIMLDKNGDKDGDKKVNSEKSE